MAKMIMSQEEQLVLPVRLKMTMMTNHVVQLSVQPVLIVKKITIMNHAALLVPLSVEK
jgi:hypothetical protein